MTTFKIAVMPGDGVGVEVIPEALKVLRKVSEASGISFVFEEAFVGGAAIEKKGRPLPEESLRLCRESDAVLFGAVGGPKWDTQPLDRRPEAGLLRLRKELDLFANLRPAKCWPMLKDASPLKASIVQGSDILVVRELSGGLYFGEPQGVESLPSGGKRAFNTMVYTSQEIERVARVAFEAARKRRKLVTSVDKANVLAVSRLWREVVTQVGRDFPDVRLEHMLVDSCAMMIASQPTRFDVILTENLFGDILSDEVAIVSASMGMLPSASLGTETALYEPVHGSAPDIAGKDIANPIATILSAAMMLRYSLDKAEDANKIEFAVSRVLEDNYRTTDIRQEKTIAVGTRKMGDLIVESLNLVYALPEARTS